VGARDPWIVPLAAAADCEERLVGGKAAKLAQLRRAGFPVPNGFCVTTRAYERFVTETGLAKVVADLAYRWFARNRVALGRLFGRACPDGSCAVIARRGE